MNATAWAARLVVLAAFLDLFAQFPVVAPYAHQLGAGPAEVGLVVATYSITNLLGNLGAGVVLDGWGRKRSLVFGLLFSAAALASYALVTTAQQLIFARALHGFATAILSPGAFALLSDVAPPERRARAMGSAGAFIALAAVVGPPFSGIVRDRFGPQVVFVSVAIVLALTALLVAALARDVTGEVTGERDRRTFNLASLQAVLRRPALLWAYVAALALTVGLGTLVTHLPILLEAQGAPARTSGYAFSVYALVALVGMAGPAALLADRFGRRRPLASGLAIIGASLAILAVFPVPPGLYVPMAVFGMGFGMLFPAATAWVADASAPLERGTAFGVFYAVYSLGVVIGSLASGVIADVLGTTSTAPFVLGAIVPLAVAPVMLVAERFRPHRIAAPEPAR